MANVKMDVGIFYEDYLDDQGTIITESADPEGHVHTDLNKPTEFWIKHSQLNRWVLVEGTGLTYGIDGSSGQTIVTGGTITTVEIHGTNVNLFGDNAGPLGLVTGPFGNASAATFWQKLKSGASSEQGAQRAWDELLKGSNTVTGSSGNDGASTHANSDGNNPAAFDTIITGAGNDLVNVVTFGAHIVAGGTGNDIIKVSKGTNLTIAGSALDGSGGAGEINALWFTSAATDVNIGNLTDINVMRLDGNINTSLASRVNIITIAGPGGAPVVVDVSGWQFNASSAPPRIFVDLADDGGTAHADTVIGSLMRDIVNGRWGNDLLKGGANNDELYGGGDSDVLDGGAGGDKLFGDDTLPDILIPLSIFEGTGIDFASYDSSLAGLTVSLLNPGMNTGDGVGDTYSFIEGLIGSRFADVLIGHDGSTFDGALNNILIGGAGGDSLNGLAGSDTASYRTSPVGLRVSLLDPGSNTNDAAGDTYIDLENLEGSDFDDVLQGNAGQNHIDGGAGKDTLDCSNETANLTCDMSVGPSWTVVVGGVPQDTCTRIEIIICGSGNDTCTGDTGSNTFKGMAGIDVFDGGAGSDTVDCSDKTAAVVCTLSGATECTITVGGVAEDRARNCESIVTGSGNDNVTGDNFANEIECGAGNDTVNSGGGNDKIIGGSGAGNNSYDGGTENDTIVFTSATSAVTINLGAASNHATGVDIGTDQIVNVENVIGGSGNNSLTGNAGVNRLEGGLGNDTYTVQTAGDTVIEAAGGGTDTVNSSITFSLAGQFAENLTLTGSGNLNATGNGLTNTLTGNGGANILDGGVGLDALNGGAGDDTYVLAGDADTVTETTGIDTITSTITRSLAAFAAIDKLILLGTSAINGTGNGLNNTITGNGAANVLDGGLGTDTLIGGGGNDTYVLANGTDAVTDTAGIDTVTSTITRSLAPFATIEKLTLLGAAAINGTGNGLANTITGNSAANILDGGLGTDTLIGGGGNDTYVLANGTDAITDTAGIDTITSTITRSLASFTTIEKLVLAGTAAINGTGNTAANTITGNTAANILDGGLGNDTLNGGGGDDTYIINSAADVLMDSAGVDLVKSTVTKILATGFEKLTLLGTATINGTGNAANNAITGNNAVNKLGGLAGSDTLLGLGGNDVLTGGTGKDTMTGGGGTDDFDFNAVAEMGKTVATRDVITDFAHLSDDIDLSTIDANGAAAGHTFSFLAAKGAAFTGAAGQLHWFTQGSGASAVTIIEGTVNADKVADFQIQLSGNKTLTAADFIL